MIQDQTSKIKDMFKRRSYAYRMVFDRNNKFLNQVLEDLAKFCRAHESTFNADPRIHAAMEGRREVWLRIQEMISLTDEELLDLHKIRQISQDGKK